MALSHCLLALLGLAAVQGLDDTCKHPDFSDGNYIHPEDCHRFVQCNNGITIEMTCPDGLYYNEQKRLCDSLDNVPRCKGTPPPVIDIKDYCSGNRLVDGSYEYPNNVCVMYIQCNNNITSVVQCPTGLVYNGIRRLCDLLEEVPKCRDVISVGPSTTTPGTTQDPNGDVRDYCLRNRFPHGSYRHPTDCTSYIVCSGYNTQILNCANGLAYDWINHNCASPSKVPGCSVKPTDGYDTYCADNNLSTGIHPDPYDCYHFVECTFGRTDHMPCPAGLAFSVSDLVCIEANKVDCRDNIV